MPVDSAKLDRVAKLILADQGSMEAKRQTREAVTDKLTELFRPRRTDLLNLKQEGERWGASIYSDTPAKCLVRWANAFLASTASRRLDWFRFELPDERTNQLDPVQQWLQECAEQQRNALARSNFYDALAEFIEDGGCDGNAFMEPIHDQDLNQAMFETQHPGDVWISRGKYGRINRVHVRKTMTAEQAWAAFGKGDYAENLPPELKRHATEESGNPLSEYEFIHARFENKDRRFGSMLSVDKEFSNVWLCKTNGKVVEFNGVDRLTLAWTPNKCARNVYGTGLAAYALTAALMGDALAKKLIQLVAKMVEPNWKASKTLRGQVDRRPGGITYVDEAAQILEQVTDKANWPIGDEQMQKFDRAIEEWFWLDLFFAMSQLADQSPKDITAFYISQLQGEKAQILTSTVSDYEAFLDDVHGFVFDVEMQAGRMPPPPDELLMQGGGIAIKPSYIGPLFQIQKEFLKVGPLMKGMDIMERVIAVFPSAADKIDEDQLTEEALDGVGFPERVQRTDEEVAQVRQARLEAQQQQEAKEAMMAGVGALPGLTKKVEKGSIADSMIGAGA